MDIRGSNKITSLYIQLLIITTFCTFDCHSCEHEETIWQPFEKAPEHSLPSWQMSQSIFWLQYLMQVADPERLSQLDRVH